MYCTLLLYLGTCPSEHLYHLNRCDMTCLFCLCQNRLRIGLPGGILDIMRHYEIAAQAAHPSISFDMHFTNVPRFQEVRYDAERCASLLTHPTIGIQPDDLAYLRLYVRPDYKLGYTRAERSAIRQANPEDYDDAGSTEMLSATSRLGNPGDILITLVYGSGFGLNKLLCHEAIHARTMLSVRKALVASNPLPTFDQRHDAKEEAEADRAMKDLALKGLRKNVIKVVRSKRENKNRH